MLIDFSHARKIRVGKYRNTDIISHPPAIMTLGIFFFLGPSLAVLMWHRDSKEIKIKIK
jgi:hypothetical protein